MSGADPSHTDSSSTRPVEVAIVGGGCAGITTAFELTRPELRGKFQVTVYQQGWRLGGKAASGRGAVDRIEEHGLHIWMGCYDNAFQLIRACYAELARQPGKSRFADWRDAFMPDPYNGVADRNAAGEWIHWNALLPPAPGDPGDPLDQREPFSVGQYLVQGAALVGTLLRSVEMRSGVQGSSPPPPSAHGLDAIRAELGRIARYGQLATLAAVIEAISLLEQAFGLVDVVSGKGQGEQDDSWILRLLEMVAQGARSHLRQLAAGDDEVRRLWEVLDFQLAILRGIVRHGLVTHPEGFDAINDFEFRQWLAENGATAETLDSAFVRALYDLFFAYEDGEPTKPRRAAGDALRSTLRMYFTYRGAFYWKLRAGMGDVMFAPLYEVLVKRGVRFEFFHRLENVRLAEPAAADDDSPYIESLEFDVQARVLGGGEYQPLVDIDGLPCWPAEPAFSQLEEGERFVREGWSFESFWDRRKVTTRSLQVGDDFDFVVLAVGLGAIPHVCRDIVARDARWQTMIERVKTTATQAFQVWMKADPEDLAWNDPPINLSGFVHPFTAYADMRQLIPEERWPTPPRTIAYFCSTLATIPAPRSVADYPLLERERVRRNAVRFLERDAGKLWPGWLDAAGRFRWDLLADPSEGRGDAPGRSTSARFDAQFWTANVNPSDRYTLSLPGSSKYRISPLDTTYDNLVVAGDWTACGYNEGCVESAVMSGRLAAHALSGQPQLKEIIGYDPPWNSRSSVSVPEAESPQREEINKATRSVPFSESFTSEQTPGPFGMAAAVTFIEDPTAQQIPGPYQAKGMLLRSFPLLAEETALRSYVDTYLNIGSDAERQFHLWPLAPVVYLQVSHTPFSHSVGSKIEVGSEDQFEINLVLLLLKLDLSFRPLELASTVAYSFVTGGWSMNTGQAILGIPKMLGEIETSAKPTQAYPTTLTTSAYRDLKPKVMLEDHLALSVLAQEEGEEPALDGATGFDILGPVDQLFGSKAAIPFYSGLLDKNIGEGELRPLLNKASLSTGVPMVQLKQLRDSQDKHLASFQGIVQSTFHGTILETGLLSPGRVEIEPLASLAISKILGIKSSAVLLPFYLTFDSVIDDIHYLYVA